MTDSRHGRRVALLSVVCAGMVMLLAGGAAASWSRPQSGAGTGAATSLATPTAVTASPVVPTSSAIDVTFTPGSNPPGTTYTVTRDKKADGTAGSQVVCSGLTASPCHDTGLKASTSFTYTVAAVLQSWTKTTTSASVSTTAATTAVLRFSACSASSSATPSCTTTANASVTIPKSNQGGGTVTAKVSLVNPDGSTYTNTSGVTITVTLAATTTGSSITGGPLTIPSGSSQTSGSFTYSNSNVATGSGADTITATATGFTSASFAVTW